MDKRVKSTSFENPIAHDTRPTFRLTKTEEKPNCAGAMTGRAAVYRGETAKSSTSETLTPRMHRPLAIQARVDLPEIQGVSICCQVACCLAPKSGEAAQRGFTQFDKHIVELIDIRKNRRIIVGKPGRCLWFDAKPRTGNLCHTSVTLDARPRQAGRFCLCSSPLVQPTNGTFELSHFVRGASPLTRLMKW